MEQFSRSHYIQYAYKDGLSLLHPAPQRYTYEAPLYIDNISQILECATSIGLVARSIIWNLLCVHAISRVLNSILTRVCGKTNIRPIPEKSTWFAQVLSVRRLPLVTSLLHIGTGNLGVSSNSILPMCFGQ